VFISVFFPRSEPVFLSRAPRSDKYVTRVEYDQLKTRVDQLESILGRITGTASVHMQPTMVAPPTMPTGAGPSNPPYPHHGRQPSGSYSLGPEYASDPYSVNTRPSVTALPSSSRTTLSGEINPPATEREIPTRPYPPPRRPVSRQYRPALSSVPAVPPYGTTEGTEERPKKRFAWTLQGVRPRQACRAVDLVRQSQLYSTILPCLFLLVCIIHLLTLSPLPPVPPRSFLWKLPLRARPSTDPLPQEGYDTLARTAIQSPLCMSPPNAPAMAGSSCNLPLLPVTNDPCPIPEPRRFGLGCIN